MKLEVRSKKLERRAAYRRRADSAFCILHSAFVLLEVVIAFGLLAIGMAIIGTQIHESYLTTNDNELKFEAMMLADSRMAQIDSLAVEFGPAQIEAGEPIEEDFGRMFPAYASRLFIGPTSIADLNSLRLEILYDRARNPDDEFNFDESPVMLTLYTLRATPTTIDLQADFGLDDDRAIQMTESFPEGEFDPNAFDPAILAKMDLEELIAALPALLDALGISAEQAARMVPPEVLQMLQEQGFGLEGEGETAGGGEGSGGGSEDGGGGGRATER